MGLAGAYAQCQHLCLANYSEGVPRQILCSTPAEVRDRSVLASRDDQAKIKVGVHTRMALAVCEQK